MVWSEDAIYTIRIIYDFSEFTTKGMIISILSVKHLDTTTS